jgi:hypothetical protein
MTSHVVQDVNVKITILAACATIFQTKYVMSQATVSAASSQLETVPSEKCLKKG